MDKDTLKELGDNPAPIAEIFKALAHENRIKTVLHLREGEMDLGDLIKAVGISKNGLINHLTILIEAGIVERVSRGTYSLTKDGEAYLGEATDQYLASERYRKERRKRDSRMYQWKRDKMSERIITNPAKYERCWFSYPGALTGCLRSLGLEVDLVDVYGVSGYGWVTNAMNKHLCPSAPSAFHNKLWEEIYKATGDLGYGVEKIEIPGEFQLDEEQKPTPESVANASKLFENVKKEIDKDRPVIVWGLVIPEYGIVNGYRDKNYIVSTYRNLFQKDDPVHYTGLMPPGGLHAIKFTQSTQPEPETASRNALKRGLRMASGEVPRVPNYTIGPDAYDVLTNNLTDEPHDENSYHGFSYTIACLHESKWGVVEYLKRADQILEIELGYTIEHYSQVQRLVGECNEIFPFAMKGELDTVTAKNVPIC
ncbi:helix-turn-helix domain-containing protein [Candidatus Bathyarchaeota archaeon]|nr:helix-turn-helix domain-containing protein [Candidatus Bathyarchaeota archaeon]